MARSMSISDYSSEIILGEHFLLDPMRIRFVPEKDKHSLDYGAISDFVCRGLEKICRSLSAYNLVQIDAMKKALCSEGLAKRAQGSLVWAAFNTSPHYLGDISGIVMLTPPSPEKEYYFAHSIYVHNKIQRGGIGQRLLTTLVLYAIEQGAQEIHGDALCSPKSLSANLRMGWKLSSIQLTKYSVCGVPIPFHPVLLNTTAYRKQHNLLIFQDKNPT